MKLTAGLHGGCIRLLTNQQSGITDITGLKGKAVGTFSMASPDRIFMSVLAAKRGIDPVKDIEWRVYPADLLGVALQKGESRRFPLLIRSPRSSATATISWRSPTICGSSPIVPAACWGYAAAWSATSGRSPPRSPPR